MTWLGQGNLEIDMTTGIDLSELSLIEQPPIVNALLQIINELKRENNPDMVIVSDDAGQFNVLHHALCWIHAERTLAKLVGFNEAQQ